MIKKLEGYITDLNKFDSKDINEIESGKMKHNGQLMGKIKRLMK